jgi:hypothetical protein
MELSVINESDKEHSITHNEKQIKMNNLTFLQEFHRKYENNKQDLENFKRSSLKQTNLKQIENNIKLDSKSLPKFQRRKSYDSNVFLKNKLSINEKNKSSLKKPTDFQNRRHSMNIINPLNLNNDKIKNSIISFNLPKDNKQFSPVKIVDRRSSVAAIPNTFFMERVNETINRSNSLNNDTHQRSEVKKRSGKRTNLTINKALQDINKPHITFNRRNSHIGPFMKIVNRIKDHKVVKRESFNESNSILAKGVFTNYFHRRLKVVIQVIGTIAFIKNEIIKFGIAPRTTRPIIEEDALNGEFTVLNVSYFRNVLKEDKGKSKKLSFFVIHPDNILIKAWNSGILILSLIFCIYYPFRMAYTDTFYNIKYMYFLIMDIIIEFIYLADIFISFFTAYYNNNGKLITSKKLIFLNYLLSMWLVFDFICMVPFFNLTSKLFEDIEYDRTSMAIMYLLLFRVFKTLFKINEIGFVEKTREMLRVNTGIVKVFFFFINTIILCHIFSCLWYFNAVCDNFGPDTWVFRYELLDEDIGMLYIRSLYYAYVVFITVGYGDITAFTNSKI